MVVDLMKTVLRVCQQVSVKLSNSILESRMLKVLNSEESHLSLKITSTVSKNKVCFLVLFRFIFDCTRLIACICFGRFHNDSFQKWIIPIDLKRVNLRCYHHKFSHCMSRYGPCSMDLGFTWISKIRFLETDAITEWKGGNGGSRATSIWVKPDSCCGSKPYNSGDKVNMISGSLPVEILNFRI